MWTDWEPETVSADFAQLASDGLTLVRVFPLWPDFQPLHRLTTVHGDFFEYRHGELPLPDSRAGRAGLDLVMLERFKDLADLAIKHELQLIVGLVTGWMSGRLFVPPAFANVEVITDPEALRWQARFVRGFVEELGDHRAIVAWDLGNECNVMGRATAAQSWLWTHTLATAIRAADPLRPVISGMHSLEASPRKPWSIHDQAELTDALTTHPYPLWTRHLDQDPITTLRPQLHATSETLFYAGVGGKPCFAEEMGSMGPFIVCDELTPQFLRPSLYSLWAHDCRAMLWWCAYDQTKLWRAPYDWIAIERELGLYRADRTAKPVVAAIKEFVRTVGGMPFKELPPRHVDAVCLLTEGQDQWAVANGAFTLAKMAGCDLIFRWFDDSIPVAPAYMLPCLNGTIALRQSRWAELLLRVEAGAALYVSLDAVLMDDLGPVFGVAVTGRQRRSGAGVISFEGRSLATAGDFKLSLKTTRATVHATEEDGAPAFIECLYGRGRVFLLTQALESAVAQHANPLAEGSYADAWQFYAKFFAAFPSLRIWRKSSSKIGVTEHRQVDDTCIVILINHDDRDLTEPVLVRAGWHLGRILHGSGSESEGISVRKSQVAILEITRD